MSGNSYSTNCPACGNEEAIMAYTDYKPYDYTSGECLECGFSYYTKEEQMSLEEVNELREMSELEPLKELVKTTWFTEDMATKLDNMVLEESGEVKCKECGDIIPALNVYPNKLCDSCYMAQEVQEIDDLVDDLGNSVTAKLKVHNDKCLEDNCNELSAVGDKCLEHYQQEVQNA